MEQNEKQLISQGAEAKVYIVNYLGEKAILKERVVKKYRHPDLDKQLSTERISFEVRNMAKARKSGINTPYIIYVDILQRSIYMQYIESIKLRDFLFKLADKSKDQQLQIKEMFIEIGKELAKMHDADIIHGDLTSSNILLKDAKYNLKEGEKTYSAIYFIDFGLSYSKSQTEDKAVDLYVLEKAFLSTHPERTDDFNLILDSYKSNSIKGAESIQRLNDVRMRGRKKLAFG